MIKSVTGPSRLLVENARIVTLARRGGAVTRRGAEAMRDLAVVPSGHVVIGADGLVAAVEAGSPSGETRRAVERIVDAEGRVVLPGFVDCHTHACWIGDRLDEWDRKLGGATYLELLESGGGIMATVRAVRDATMEQLAEATTRHLRRMLAFGTTTVEVKTGYGPDLATEVRMLDAIERAAERVPMHVVPTYLGAHALDPDRPEAGVEEIIGPTLDAVAARRPGVACDAYCEQGAWDLGRTRRLLERARDLGCPLRLHTDQFHVLGGTRLALELGARSVDHLEATTPDDIAAIGRAHERTTAVCLPVSGFHLDGRYADGRALVDAGAVVALATNCNPGSAPTPSMPFAMALACRHLGLVPAETITAATRHGARVLGLERRVGAIEPGLAGDLVMWDVRDERELAHEIADRRTVPARYRGSGSRHRPCAATMAPDRSGWTDPPRACGRHPSRTSDVLTACIRPGSSAKKPAEAARMITCSRIPDPGSDALVAERQEKPA